MKVDIYNTEKKSIMLFMLIHHGTIIPGEMEWEQQKSIIQQ